MLIIHHWELWYTLFNFDNNYKLHDKICFVNSYIDKNLTCRLFLIDVLNAIFFMFLGYLVIVGTRSLVLWVEFGLMPMITGKIINKNVVRRSEYEDVVKERESYFDQYEEQRKHLREFSKTIDEQTEELKLKDNSLIEQSSKITKTVKDLDLTKKKLENSESINKKNEHQVALLTESFDVLKKENEIKIKYIEFFSSIFFLPESKLFYTSPDQFPPPVTEKVIELKNENEWHTFLIVANFLENGGSISSPDLTKMIRLGVSLDRENGERLTPIGKIIWNYREVFENYKS